MNIKAREKTDQVIKIIFRTTGMLVIAVLAGIFMMLLWNSIAFFLDVKPWDFITGTQWDPSGKKASYGMLPLLVSTSIVTLGAMAIAIPLSIGTAAFISEDLRAVFKGVLADHMHMPRGQIDAVFPDAGSVAPLAGLIRA